MKKVNRLQFISDRPHVRRYLTKSIFKIGLECPRKLFYHKKPTEYFNGKEEDPFLESLAQGGYQVGALAQLKYPGGVEIKERDYTAAAENTQRHFTEEHAVLFEAAFLKDNLYVRADISIKAGSNLRIIEVKSKSFESDDNDAFLSPQKSKPGVPKLYSNWVPYIYDLAFQVFVARLNYPNLTVKASMMLLDKTAAAVDDGLHQLFLVKKSGSSKECAVRARSTQSKGQLRLIINTEYTCFKIQIASRSSLAGISVRLQRDLGSVIRVYSKSKHEMLKKEAENGRIEKERNGLVWCDLLSHWCKKVVFYRSIKYKF